MKAFAVSFVCAGVVAGAAIAQPYYVRGEFNGWSNSTDAMTQIGSNAWKYTVTGLNPGQGYEFKATVDDWSMNAPGSNARYVADANGELTVFLYDTNTHGDGWSPEGKWRLGWADSGLFGWELVGEMNGWGGGGGWELVDQGGGLHSADFSLGAGTYEFKFRRVGDWGYSIGDDFGNSAANNSITVGGALPVRFELDLEHGRWRAYEVPAPGAFALLGVAGVVGMRRRR